MAPHRGARAALQPLQNSTFAVVNTQRAILADLGPAFTARDVSVVTALAQFAELTDQPKRAAELRAIGHKIALDRAGIQVGWSLLHAGRVGFMAVQLARDPDGFDLIGRARYITRRITRRAVGSAFDLVSIETPAGETFAAEG